MQISLPNINLLMKGVLPVKASFVGDYIHPALGKTATQTIEQWRLNYLKELKLNNSFSDFEKFKVFIVSLLLRASKGEVGGKLYDAFNDKIKEFSDLNKESIKIVLRDSGYRFQNQATETVLNSKELLFNKYQGKLDKYFKEAKENYRNNFPNDDFLKIKGVSFKVRDLALSCFLKEYSANDFHVVDVLARTGLILYGYGDLNFGTNPNNGKNYLFLRNSIIKISKQTGYSPGEIDRIFWHFGRAVCKNKPLCGECPIKNICLTYKNKK
jgi:thermostable 8-oxoguanine DNA glycosylase